MSLADRIATNYPNRANRGCESCLWWPTISCDAQQLINEWIDSGHSQSQLYYIISADDPNSDDPPLPVSLSAWRFHLRHHAETCR